MRKISIGLMITTLLAAVPSSANCQSDCKKALDSADKVIADLHKQIDLEELRSTAQAEMIANLNVALNDKNQALEAWYRNPFIVGLLGFAAGVVTIELLPHAR